ncbi:glycosyltransferase family 2 protein [Psychromonas sp. KJ10-2]|uniref:glycosyltransferase family 2 protein n=1 Tax=Psychromonas sp. KJ10-2 TaxID=3391822 RepID=UPI0039B53578
MFNAEIIFLLKAMLMMNVSAVIPAYNRPDYLESAIKSVLAQTYPISEIIVVDDCSTTDLLPVILAFKDERIHYHKSTTNMGNGYSRNQGTKMANGDWIAYLDDDDIWYENKVELQIQSIEKHNCIACLTSLEHLETGKIHQPEVGEFVEDKHLRLGNLYCGTSGLLVSKAAILPLLFDETLKCGVDWDIYIRLNQVGKIYYLQQPLFYYRQGTHSGIISNLTKMKIENYDSRLTAIKKHRHWLGEHKYKKRLAKQILYYAFSKPKPQDWIYYSIKEAESLLL